MLTFGQLHTLAETQNLGSMTRQSIMLLTVYVGQMSSIFLSAPMDPIPPTENDSGVANDAAMPVNTWTAPCGPLFGRLLYQLAVTACSVKLDLQSCVLQKMQLNAKKYPVELCKGKDLKYTAYSKETGITKSEGQEIQLSEEYNTDEDLSIKEVEDRICKFANERQWSRFHTPRNLLMALTGELGELSELLQWRGDDLNMKLTEDELQKVGQELADVTIYLLRLAHVCKVSIDEHTLQVCLDNNPS